MKTESRIFEILTIFFFVVAIVYLLIAREAAGTSALFLTGGLSLIVGTYWPFGLTLSVALMAISLAYMYFWAVTISGVILLIAIGGLIFEYHIRPSEH